MHRHNCFRILVSALLFSITLPAPAQRFVQTNSGPSTTAPGAASTWGIWACTGCQFNGTYQYIAGKFQQVTTPVPFLTISVGGGSVMQFDEVWATDFNNLIYRWDPYSQAFHQVAGSLTNIEIGEGYTACHQYEVWGTDVNHQVWRYNYCTFTWDSVPGFLNGLAVGGGEVWALNGYNEVFRYNPTSNAFDLMPGRLAQVAVGAGGVWGVGTDSSVWQFNPSTQNWDQIPGQLDAISAGADGVFGFFDVWQYPNGPNQVLRLDPGARTWTTVFSVTGALTQIGQVVVGTGAGTWMEAGLGFVYYYVTL